MDPRHPVLDGPPTRKARSSGLVAMLIILGVVLAVWLVSGGEPGTPTGTDPRLVDISTSAPGADEIDARVDERSGLPSVELSALPPRAAQVTALIEAGGPFPYPQDGSTFGNFEGLLPQADRSYYEEYTVAAPGAQDRGARRLVAGDDGELYWTSDHYRSFAAVAR